MQDTKETGTSHNTIQEIAEAFSREASSLLPEDSIRQTLEKEEKRFENASALQISPSTFIGNNTARHRKELLRRSQPIFPLYLLLGFFTETSMVLLLYGLLMSGYQYFFIPGKDFSQPFPAVYGIIVITGFLLYHYISHEIWTKGLAQTTDKPESLLKSIKNKKRLTGIILLALCVSSLAGIYSRNMSGCIQISILDTLTFYAACAILSGIHNLIYDSHILSFLAVGANTLSPGKSPQAAGFAENYIISSLQQILNQKASASQEEDHLKAAGKVLRTRLLSFRIYGSLGFFILIILDILCLWQLLHTFTLPLCLFFLLAVPCTLLCLIVILSAQTVLKSLRTKEREN